MHASFMGSEVSCGAQHVTVGTQAVCAWCSAAVHGAWAVRAHYGAQQHTVGIV